MDGALKVEESKDHVKLFGRGELHLGVILEKMRREKYHFQTTSPEIVFKTDKKG